jgi:hypothetical protein
MHRLLFVSLAAPVVYFFSTLNCFAMCAIDQGKDNGGYQVIHNSCGYPISFKWIDQGTCSTGCLEWLGPNTTHIVTGMHGSVRAAECQGYCNPHIN